MLVLAGTVSIAVAHAAPESAGVVKGQLANGLSYVIDTSGPDDASVELRLVVDTPDLDAKGGDKSIAHLIEHLAFRKVKSREEDVGTVLDSLGLERGVDWGGSAGDRTVYHLTYRAAGGGGWREGLGFLRDWADGIVISPNDISVEEKIIAREGGGDAIRSRSDFAASVRIKDEILYSGKFSDELLLHDIAFALPPQGTPAPYIEDRYRRWYRAENMLVVVVGHVDATEAERLIHSAFENLRGGGSKIVGHGLADDLTVRVEPQFRSLSLQRDGLEGRRVSLHMRAPSSVSSDPISALRRQVVIRIFNEMLEAKIARLQENFRPAARASINSAYNNSVYGPRSGVASLTSFVGSVNDEEIEGGLEELVDLLKFVDVHGFDEEDFEPSKDKALRAAASEATPADVASYWVEAWGNPAAVYPRDVASILRLLDRDLGIEDINDLARTVIDFDKGLLVVEERGLGLSPLSQGIVARRLARRAPQENPISSVSVPTKLSKRGAQSGIGRSTAPSTSSLPVDFAQTGSDTACFGIGAKTKVDTRLDRSAYPVLLEIGAGDLDRFQLRRFNKSKGLTARVVREPSYLKLQICGPSRESADIVELGMHLLFKPRNDQAAAKDWVVRESRLRKSSEKSRENIIGKAIGDEAEGAVNLETVGRVMADVRNAISLRDNIRFAYAGSADRALVSDLIANFELPDEPSRLQVRSSAVDDSNIQVEPRIIQSIAPGIGEDEVRYTLQGEIANSPENRSNFSAAVKAISAAAYEAIRIRRGGAYYLFTVQNVAVKSATDTKTLVYRIEIRFQCAPHSAPEMAASMDDAIYLYKSVELNKELYERSRSALVAPSSASGNHELDVVTSLIGKALGTSFQFDPNNIDLMDDSAATQVETSRILGEILSQGIVRIFAVSTADQVGEK